ncbi:RmlC-like cupin [Microthyrium microscopicum]|uniref:RmlC-like cupin n=1 Tax=Microthyrium microscopicum TaxID=703497 RepID=A0A6A6U677_9PEZI|nr:RmlC-like cupin [Microthyrium microscopicum]
MKSVTVLGAIASSTALTEAAKSLWVNNTPLSVQPYAILKGHGTPLGGGDVWNRFPVSGNSSGGAFTIMTTHGPGDLRAGPPGLFPHVHKKTYENFFATKGRIQLWAQGLDGFLKGTTQQLTRILTKGDFGAVPQNGIHTFKVLDHDSTLTGVLVPGGFEEFFFAMSKPTFNPTALNTWDVYPQLNFTPRADAVNSKGGEGNWYNGPNTLPGSNANPYFIAKNYGPKYINDKHGYYQIITPLVTGKESNNQFAQGHITMDLKRGNKTSPTQKVAQHMAFMLEEGELHVGVEGYDEVRLIEGDIVFVPKNTPFTYYAGAEFTKFMYVSGGGDGLDATLIQGGKPTSKAVYPVSQDEATAFSAPGISDGGKGGKGGMPMLRIPGFRI